jgi:hypothetical protein
MRENPASRRARYQRRRAIGLCVRCGKESGKLALCFGCRVTEAAKGQRRRDKAKVARVVAQHKARKAA